MPKTVGMLEPRIFLRDFIVFTATPLPPVTLRVEDAMILELAYQNSGNRPPNRRNRLYWDRVVAMPSCRLP
jgi:hypothetical protein